MLHDSTQLCRMHVPYGRWAVQTIYTVTDMRRNGQGDLLRQAEWASPGPLPPHRATLEFPAAAAPGLAFPGRGVCSAGSQPPPAHVPCFHELSDHPQWHQGTSMQVPVPSCHCLQPVLSQHC